MKAENIAAGALIIAVAVIIVYALFGSPALPKPSAQGVQESPWRTVSTGSTDTGDVELSLTPLGQNGALFEVSLAANTHSVDLSPFDLNELAVLSFQGQEVRPSRAPEMAGHHVSGKLAFEASPGEVFTITITGVPAVQERVYQWT